MLHEAGLLAEESLVLYPTVYLGHCFAGYVPLHSSRTTKLDATKSYYQICEKPRHESKEDA